MSKEREKPKRSFEDTQKAYRTAYETLVEGQLEASVSPMMRKIAVEESRLLTDLQRMKDGKGTKSDAQKVSGVIAFNLGRLSVPVALPVNYQGRKRVPENRHNMAQTYLFS